MNALKAIDTWTKSIEVGPVGKHLNFVILIYDFY